MKNACDILLVLDLHSAAQSIGLQPPSKLSLVNEENLYTIINEIEIALLEGNKDRQISSVCGLLWTHFGEKFDLLSEYIFNTMAKIGFSPVISMLENKIDLDKRILYSSVVSMFETTAQIQRETLNVFGKKYFLTRFQKELWVQIEKKSHIAVSAPTSAGKSFLICLNLIYGVVKRGGVSIYIVPTLTLMGQVANDIINLAREHNQIVSIKTHLCDNWDHDISTIYVVTQERLSDHERFLKTINKINYLIIDEVQNIERAFNVNNDDTRAKLLFDVLINIHDNYSPDKTIILGPRIAEVGELGEKLFNKRCVSVAANSSPVTNICYSLTPARDKDEITLTQYSELNIQHLSISVANTIGATGFGKARYDEIYLAYLQKMLVRNEGSLIFSPTSIQARNTALRLAGARRLSDDILIKSLAKYIESTVAPQYDLVACIRKGVAYHHGKIPHHVRNAVELALTQGKIPLVACTTTLMQGVNIPVRSVFLRNPNLFIQNRSGNAAKLSGYEVANLRGRAGRLLKDFVGRTFILDGTSFKEEEDQQSLFEPATKQLDGSYSKVFLRNRDEIVSSLVGDKDDRGSLAKYIGNILYTNPAGAAVLLRKGIRLSDKELADVKWAQRKLTVTTEICRAHRFWDPFDLQTLQDQIKGFILPSTPFVRGAADNIEKLLIKIFSILPAQAIHYLHTKEKGHNMPMMLAISSVDWANEKPLNKLLDTKYAKENSNNTEKAISNFQNTISYGIPALLSPIYAMFSPNSILLGAIERGAHQAGSIAQINNNVPRETAIAVTRNAKDRNVSLTTMPEVLAYLRKTKVDYWNAIQFRHIIDIKDIMDGP